MNKYLLIIIILITVKLNAQQIVTDRHDQTEASSTIPKGSLQIESGSLVAFTEFNNSIEKQILLPTTLFRYGLTN
ncbi:MAG: hypothetical protein D6677_12605 [Calditrichaeota bacterium]|nr:MAG: hypothetical protein D6677_12605 [Calditrichota bacterium]